jgi:RNA polymerase sigma factor (sigma-70 family)
VTTTAAAAETETAAETISLRLLRVSDEQLGSRLASGEAAAFDELYRRYVNRLAAYGSHLLGDGSAGDDVAQTTLLKAYTALRAGRVPSRVRPWLYRVAHNVALDLVTRRRELPAATLPELASPQGGTSAGALLEALAALPERQRHVYVLRELHGLRIDETAAELGLAAPQVEQALFAARNRLAEHLVFGNRLDCVTVRRLAAGPLAADERRALKTHLRSCPDCRANAGPRARVLSVFPVVSATWLRGLLAGIGTGGAPAAVKLTAVAATASLAVGLPASVELSDPGSKPLHLPVPPAKPLAARAHEALVHSHVTAPAVQAAAPIRTSALVPVRSDRRRQSDDRRNASQGDGGQSVSRDERARSGSDDTAVAATSGSNEGPGSGTAGTTSAPATAPATTTPTHDGPGGGSDDPVVTTTTLPTTTTTPTVTSGSGDGHDGGSDGGVSGPDGGSPDGSGSDGHG